MNFTLTPSLEDRALVLIAIKLCSQEDVRDSILTSFHFDINLMNEIKKLLDQVTKLPLPNILKLKVSKCIKAVGENILSWIMFHDTYCISMAKLPAVFFFWTPQGTIDKKKTAEAWVKDETFEVHQRFEVACTFCFEEDIHDLWKTSHVRQRKHLYKTPPFGDISLISFWACYLDEEYDDFAMRVNAPDLTAYQYGFRDSAMCGNKVATEYFLQKLNPEEEGDFIMKTAREVAIKVSSSRDFTYQQCSEVLLFLLSTMTIKQQRDIFSSHLYAVLKALLVWPWQTQFLEVVLTKLTLLSREEHKLLLSDIVRSNNYDPDLFRKLWQITLKNYKEYFTDPRHIKSLFYWISYNKDEKNLQMILKDLSAQTRKEIAFDPEIYMFNDFVKFELWDSIKFFIEECIPSPEEIVMFENRYRKYAAESYSKLMVECEYEAEDYKQRWDIFFQIVEECKKRSI